MDNFFSAFSTNPARLTPIVKGIKAKMIKSRNGVRTLSKSNPIKTYGLIDESIGCSRSNPIRL